MSKMKAPLAFVARSATEPACPLLLKRLLVFCVCVCGTPPETSGQFWPAKSLRNAYYLAPISEQAVGGSQRFAHQFVPHTLRWWWHQCIRWHAPDQWPQAAVTIKKIHVWLHRQWPPPVVTDCVENGVPKWIHYSTYYSRENIWHHLSERCHRRWHLNHRYVIMMSPLVTLRLTRNAK